MRRLVLIKARQQLCCSARSLGPLRKARAQSFQCGLTHVGFGPGFLIAFSSLLSNFLGKNSPFWLGMAKAFSYSCECISGVVRFQQRVKNKGTFHSLCNQKMSRLQLTGISSFLYMRMIYKCRNKNLSGKILDLGQATIPTDEYTNPFRRYIRTKCALTGDMPLALCTSIPTFI